MRSEWRMTCSESRIHPDQYKTSIISGLLITPRTGTALQVSALMDPQLHTSCLRCVDSILTGNTHGSSSMAENLEVATAGALRPLREAGG